MLRRYDDSVLRVALDLEVRGKKKREPEKDLEEVEEQTILEGTLN